MLTLLDHASDTSGLSFDALLAFQDADGGFKLLDSYEVEADARVEFCHEPNYIGAAILMRRWLGLKSATKRGVAGAASETEQDIRERLTRALDVSCHRDLLGHGYDAFAGELFALEIFIKGGLRSFLAMPETATLFPKFHQTAGAAVREVAACDGLAGEKFEAQMTRIVNAMNAGKMYLAYGSNMNSDRMRKRCPDAKKVGVTVVKNRCLCFHGYANMEPAPGEETPAVVWTISDANERKLDECEGFPKDYDKVQVEVELNGKTVLALAYVMTDWKRRTCTPKCVRDGFDNYVGIIKQGYRDAGFDEALVDAALRGAST
ncbi:MAG: gamma-glutamylcyclotransferase [Opitutaceae bacterium]|nr:gamma-glutamylcyclotransferase [Opitutaceae bacterium]